MKLEKTRVTMPAACSRRAVTFALSLLLFMCVAVRPLAATLVHVQGPTVLQPRELCSDHPDAAIATFEDAELEAEIRDALRESVGAQKDLTCGLRRDVIEVALRVRGEISCSIRSRGC